MDHTLLVSELQSLVTESKRRHPEVKDTGERALEVLKSAQGNELGKHADKLLLPITLGCKTKVGKIVGISISALQRLVTLRSVPTEHLPAVLTTLNSVSGQAVDIQLKLLQTLLSILTFNPDVHDEVLGNALLLCFKLQDSRVSVVSSTAAATLRQAVMLVFDRISSDLTKPTLPLTLSAEPEEQVTLTPSAMDAYNIFADLCLLTAGGGSSGFSLWGGGKEAKPRVLKLNTLQRTFGLELIESVLSGYEEAVKKRPELLHLLKSSLDPLLIKLLSDKPTFPVALRVCRLEFLLIRSFTEKLPLQVEGYLTTLIKLGTGEAEADDTSKKENVYPWLRGLALEIFRGVCGDSRLLRTVWTNFDQTGKSDVFRKMVSSLGKLVNERPVLLGVGAQMHGTGVPSGDGSAASGTYLDMGLGMVSSAASAGLNSVNSMMGSSGGGLGTHSSMKLRLIEQHDKLEAPIIPETYIYLLALQSMDAVAESIYVAAGQTAEPDPVVKGMAESAWPALLAALSFCMGTNLSDGLFAEVLSALQDFTTACGLLGLSTPRDAFFSTLGKYAVPPPAVSAMQSYMDAPTISRASAGMISVDSLGLGGPQSATPPALSERNLACLRSVVLTARILASTLGDSWHDVLEVLQNANFMLGAKKPNMPRRPTLASPQLGSTATMGRQSIEGSEQSRPEVFDELDVESIQSAINLLFDGTRDLSDSAFTTFILALCRLSSEMIGVSDRPTNSVDVPSSTLMSPGPRSPTMEAVRRRSSGINISNSIKSGERSYSLGKIRIVAMLNLGRIVNSDPSIGWTTVTQHLLAVARHHTAPSTIRIQASDTLADLLLGAIRVGKSSDVQHHVFDVLVRQVDSEPVSSVLSTDYDVRASGYQTLNQILESSGHSLEVGWKTIFDMLDIVCRDTSATPLRRTDSQISISSTSARPSTLSKGDVNLVRITFPSLNLICTDFLSSLDPDSMRRCISCLGCFGKQQEDVNITLAAIGLLWNVSDAVQADNKDLWLYLLSVLMNLGQDQRLEVRSSAIQTLFRCIDLYGSTLSSELWEEVFWDVISPLLNVNTADESAILSLTSVGAMFNAFLRTLSTLPSFKRIYRHFLASTETAFASEAKKCVTAGLKALEKTLSTVDFSSASDATSGYIGDETWSAYVRMASAVNGEKAYTQENLVALVRIAGALHPDLERQSDRIPQFSSILRSLLTYSRSPEYRPDIDTVSPLQDAIVKLISSSTVLPPSVVLADLAEFTSLAYLGAGTKVTYVAVSKVCMPIMADVLNKHAKDLGVFSDGTAEAVIGAYALPIKLKYDCPPANKYGEDPPLWRTAMKAFASIVGTVMSSLSTEGLPRDRFDGIWIQIVDLFGGILLADDSILDASVGRAEDDESFIMPILDDIGSHVVPNLPAAPADASKRFAQMLSKASRLYRSDSTSTSGTTSMSIPEPSERMRYWAFDTLNNMANESTKATQRKEDQGEFARVITEIVVDRLGDTLSRFAADSELRGQMPMPRVREEELLYVLRTLATLRIRPDSLMPGKGDSTSNSMLAGPRGHLIKFYPILLRLAFLRGHLPSMWMFPSEYETLFSTETAEEAVSQGQGVARMEDKDVDAGDGTDLIQVSARDLVRFCLELVGTEILATSWGAQ